MYYSNIIKLTVYVFCGICGAVDVQELPEENGSGSLDPLIFNYSSYINLNEPNDGDVLNQTDPDNSTQIPVAEPDNMTQTPTEDSASYPYTVPDEVNTTDMYEGDWLDNTTRLSNAMDGITTQQPQQPQQPQQDQEDEDGEYENDWISLGDSVFLNYCNCDLKV